MTYLERLYAPFGWWLAGLSLSVLVAASVHNGADGWRATVPYVVVPLVAVALLLATSRRQVLLQDDVLHVPGARAPVGVFGPAEVLSGRQLAEWRGMRAHRDAFVSVRPWDRKAVRLPVVDAADDTPYWLVGTRRPVDLVVALEGVPR